MLSKLFQILLVLFLGGLFACIFSVPVRNLNCFYGKHLSFLRHRKKIRNIAAVLSWYLFLFSFFMVVAVLFYYNLSRYFSRISWEQFVEMIKAVWHRLFDIFPFINNLNFDSYTSAVLDFFMKIPGVLGKLAISILISVYLLIDWNYYLSSFRKWKNQYLKQKTNHILTTLIDETKDNLYGYLKGQSLDAVIMGLLLSIGLWFIDVPLGIPIGIIAGIGNFIPYVGPVIAFTFTTLFCLIENRVRTLIIAFLFLILVQQLDSSFIGPKLLGKQMQIRPLFVIVSVLIGGTLFGPMGLIFAVPVAGLIKSLIKKFYLTK